MNSNTKHSPNCLRIFNHYDMQCPRCQELAAGAPARDGWQKSYYSRKEANEQIRRDALRTHNCQTAGCGPVCTFGDW